MDKRGSVVGNLKNVVGEGSIKNCAVCGISLERLEEEAALACYFCGEEYRAEVWCPDGHYVCHACHHMPISNFIEEMVKTSRSKDPYQLAALMMAFPTIRKRSCEHAWIFTAALLIAVKNEGTVQFTDQEVLDVVDAVKKQTNVDLLNNTGMCGMVSAACTAFQAIFSKAFSVQSEDNITMKVVAQAIGHLADDSSRCKCCKSAVITTLALLASFLTARFGIDFKGSADDIICNRSIDDERCDPMLCQYSVVTHE